MCLVALALDKSRRFPLVIASNRDEFFRRPAARLAWWTPHAGAPAILSGRDLESGGTWLGLTAQGRLALLTNVRGGLPIDPAAPSRGRIVPEWLAAHEPVGSFWMRTALAGHNGFNLIAADFRQGECFWASNAAAHPQRLERGIYGLSNAGLDSAWPKVDALKARLATALAEASSVDALADALFAALGDRHLAPVDHLPSTGIPVAWEHQLSAAFIRTPDLAYGTRCSTLVITERGGRQPVTHVLERSFTAGDGVALLRRSTLRHWPPRYVASDHADDPAQDDGDRDREREAAAEQSAVSESEVAARPDATAAPERRTRVRTLLKREPGRRTR